MFRYIILQALEKLVARIFYRHAYDCAGDILVVGDRIQLRESDVCWGEDAELKFATIRKIDNRIRYPLTIQIEGSTQTQGSEAHNVKKITCDEDIYEPSGPADEEECQKFFDDTAKERRQLHDKRFEYHEAYRNPKTSPETLTNLEKEMRELQKGIYSKAPQGCW